MSAIKVTRTPGQETDTGDFEFRVTMPKESVAAFFAAFPGFELDLIVPQAISCKPSIDLPEAFPTKEMIDYTEKHSRELYQQASSLNITVPEYLTLPVNKLVLQPEQCVIPTQSLSMQSWDSAQVGMTIAPNADILNLCRLPTFQEYALRQSNQNAAEVENIDHFALEYALTVCQKDIVSITAEDYLNKLFLPFSEWLRAK